MNQTESGRKARGRALESSRNETRYLPTERRLARKGPRLKLRACFAAPDPPVLG